VQLKTKIILKHTHIALDMKDKREDKDPMSLYKSGGDYGTVSPKDVYKSGGRYGTVSPKDVYKSGGLYGAVSQKEF